ncbi:HTH_Tnp_Tc3_2 domain-containing protein [Trichonephila clavipes]|nr:HTH_Tnp_Tc3_2 domain-containing protein [Trichonephila clavipes]
MEVSKKFVISSRLWQKFQDDGNVNKFYNTGYSRVTTLNEYRHLATAAKRCRRSMASDLSRLLSVDTVTTVSRQTVNRRWRLLSLCALRPVRCVMVIAAHCHQQLAWNREPECGHRYSGLV